MDEEDEWTAIQNFNTMLHYEEQKQALMREMERRRLIKEELDKQIVDKHQRNLEEQQEATMYDNLQKKHVELLD